MAKRSTTRLIASEVDKLTPTEQRYTIGDRDIPGFEVRVSSTGAKTFSITYRTHDGKRERYTIGQLGRVTADRARKIAKARLGEVANNGNPHAEKRLARKQAAAPPLRDFIDRRYSDYVLDSDEHRSGDQTIARLKAAFSPLLDKPIDEITAWDVSKWRMNRSKGDAKPSTIRRDLGALRAMYGKAISWDVVGADPTRDEKLPKVDRKGRPRFLSEPEEARLRDALRAREEKLRGKRQRFNEWRATRGLRVFEARAAPYSDHLEPIVLLVLNSGLRRGELFNLEWRDIDFRRRMLTVRAAAAKDEESREIPINQESRAVLTAWRDQHARDDTPIVFHNRGRRLTTIKTAWGTLLRDAGITSFTFHGIRHTFATRLLARGASINVVRDLLGHSDITMTARYLHSTGGGKTAAVAKLGHGGS